jgi:hypothetical protein
LRQSAEKKTKEFRLSISIILQRGWSFCGPQIALSSSTCAYDDDGKKQQDFHGEKLHQRRGGCNG